MFQPRQHNNEVVGYEGRTKDALFFFGTKHCTKEMLSQLFPNLAFCYLNQVHGGSVVRANVIEPPTADGHYTRERNFALVIQTADCMPILLSSPKQVMALHVGWRGFTAQIIKLAARCGSFSQAAIGPHIQSESFEVGLGVANQLKLTTTAEVVLPHPTPQKRRVDLAKIAQTQLRAFFYKELPIEVLKDDTFTSPLFHSYRRGGKTKTERQYSFVALVDY